MYKWLVYVFLDSPRHINLHIFIFFFLSVQFLDEKQNFFLFSFCLINTPKNVNFFSRIFLPLSLAKYLLTKLLSYFDDQIHSSNNKNSKVFWVGFYFFTFLFFIFYFNKHPKRLFTGYTTRLDTSKSNVQFQYTKINTNIIFWYITNKIFLLY